MTGNIKLQQVSLAGFASIVLGGIMSTLPNPLFGIAIPVLVPIAIAVFRNPVWVCLGFIIFSFFRIHEAIPVLMPFKIPQLLALASFAVLGWHIFIANTISLYWSKLLTLFSLFFLLICLGAVFATDRGAAIGAITGTFSKIAIMVCAIAWLIRTPKDFHRCSMLIILAGCVIGSIAITNKLNGIGLVEGTRVTIGRNIGSMIGDPNDLALVLTFPLSFAAGMLFSKRSPGYLRLFAVLGYGIIAWAILCTQSRGGLLGMTTVTGLLAWQSTKRKALVIAAGVLALAILGALAGLSERKSGGAAEEGIDESAMGRIYAWQAAISMATHHPLTGVGINNFYANYYFHSPHWDGKNHAVHSTWFQVLAESGFLGLIIFIILVYSTFQFTRKNNQRIRLNPGLPPSVCVMGNALQSGLAGFCISGTFLTQGFIWPLYILMALTIGLNYYLDSHCRTKTETPENNTTQFQPTSCFQISGKREPS
ncbi:O-antigen polymerase [Oleiphilus messinensis]|uniref:O-antigen polymerase n=1 Tax=Oleiphilus messinensis TaxID=141451 RepID=A0A1Y0I479_9GAMM|nr:O-antigen ligase family protein [Oleiphilus messinensis]ARU55221.1 O-antigen polymerase [Oleiphilus messinensis]